VSGIDGAIAKVANQHIIRERAEVCGSHHHAPGRVQGSAGHPATEKAAVGVKYID
jgi:hypothetical protein